MTIWATRKFHEIGTNFKQLPGMNSAYNPTSQRVTNYHETHEVGMSKRSIVASKPQETWIIWDHLGYLYLAFCEMNILYVIISPSPELLVTFSGDDLILLCDEQPWNLFLCFRLAGGLHCRRRSSVITSHLATLFNVTQPKNIGWFKIARKRKQQYQDI